MKESRPVAAGGWRGRCDHRGTGVCRSDGSQSGWWALLHTMIKLTQLYTYTQTHRDTQTHKVDFTVYWGNLIACLQWWNSLFCLLSWATALSWRHRPRISLYKAPSSTSARCHCLGCVSLSVHCSNLHHPTDQGLRKWRLTSNKVRSRWTHAECTVHRQTFTDARSYVAKVWVTVFKTSVLCYSSQSLTSHM